MILDCELYLLDFPVVGRVYDILALEADVNTRGIQGKTIDGVKLVDYATFVELATQHDRVQAWL